MSIGDRLLFPLITGFGTGFAPMASGTFGTLPAVAIGLGLQYVWQGRELALALLGLAAVLLAIGCAVTGFVQRQLGAKDPKQFVLDEIVGYLITLGILALVVDPSLYGHAAAFFFFRLFDVLKLSPARELEHLEGAKGIMLDDVAAGVQAGVVLLGLWYVDLI